jgi:hypothetical protein
MGCSGGRSGGESEAKLRTGLDVLEGRWRYLWGGRGRGPREVVRVWESPYPACIRSLPPPHPILGCRPHPAEQYRLEYADLDAFLSALLVHTVAPPCGANMPVRGLPMLSVHPLSLGGFYRIIHSLVTVLGYPAHW